MKNDPKVTKTCTLVIESATKAQAGVYKFYSIDRKELQVCSVDVVDERSIIRTPESALPYDVFVLLLVLLVTIPMMTLSGMAMPYLFARFVRA